MSRIKWTHCSDMFKSKDGAYPIVQFANGYNGDTFIDIRLVKRTKARGWVMLTCNGGKKGFKQALKFVIKNRKKLMRIVKGSREMRGLKK